MVEVLIAQLSILVVVIVICFVAGAALTAGAWVTWRLLEQRRAQGAAGESGGTWLTALIVMAVLAAASFAFAPRQLGLVAPQVSAEFAILSLVPFAVLTSLFVGAALLVRRAMR